MAFRLRVIGFVVALGTCASWRRASKYPEASQVFRRVNEEPLSIGALFNIAEAESPRGRRIVRRSILR